MIAVMFEVRPAEGHAERYFELAGNLKSELAKIEGFISVERFQSLTDDGKYLSLSFWRDEQAVENWFCHAGHRDAQSEGRSEIFEDYRIRVASIFRDYDLASGRPEN